MNNVEIICLYKENWNGESKDKRFDSYDIFGKWVADNAVEISIIDVIQKEW